MAVVLFSCLQVTAQEKTDTLTAKVYFRTGSAQIDADYNGNGETLQRFERKINSLLANPEITLNSISIETGASPEGDPATNERLSLERAKSIRKHLIDNLPLNAQQIKAFYIGADWEGLVKMVRKSDCEWKDEILKAVADSDVRIGAEYSRSTECLAKLRAIDKGKAWKWLNENVFPALRAGTGNIKCEIIRRGEAAQRDTLVIIHEYEGPDPEWYLKQATEKASQISVQEVLDSLEKKPKKTKIDSLLRTPSWELRTNLLVPAMNIGAEIPLSNRWSLSADIYFPWAWRKLTNLVLTPYQYCFEAMWGTVEGRYWLGPAHRNDRPEYSKYRLTGHSFGVVLAGGYYDMEYTGAGIQGEGGSIGLDYMYTLPVCKGNMRIEFNIGIGLGVCHYRGYDVPEGDNRLIGNYKDGWWIGPVPIKAAIGLALPIYGKNNGKEVNHE